MNIPLEELLKEPLEFNIDGVRYQLVAASEPHTICGTVFHKGVWRRNWESIHSSSLEALLARHAQMLKEKWEAEFEEIECVSCRLNRAEMELRGGFSFDPKSWKPSPFCVCCGTGKVYRKVTP